VYPGAADVEDPEDATPRQLFSEEDTAEAEGTVDTGDVVVEQVTKSEETKDGEADANTGSAEEEGAKKG